MESGKARMDSPATRARNSRARMYVGARPDWIGWGARRNGFFGRAAGHATRRAIEAYDIGRRLAGCGREERPSKRAHVCIYTELLPVSGSAAPINCVHRVAERLRVNVRKGKERPLLPYAAEYYV